MVDMRSLTQIMNENLHSYMRAGNSDMPTTKEYAQRFPDIVMISILRMCAPALGFIFDTSHHNRASGYGTSQLECNVKFDVTKYFRANKTRRSAISQEDRALMVEFASHHGKSVPQTTVRALSAKNKAGFLPYGAWNNQTPVPCRSTGSPSASVSCKRVQWERNGIIVVQHNGVSTVYLLSGDVLHSDTTCSCSLCKEEHGTVVGTFRLTNQHQHILKRQVSFYIPEVKPVDEEPDSLR